MHDTAHKLVNFNAFHQVLNFLTVSHVQCDFIDISITSPSN